MTGGAVLQWTRVNQLDVWGTRRLVRIGARSVRLTRGEMAVLTVLLRASGEPVTRVELSKEAAARPLPAWKRSRLVDQLVHTLRRKLGDDARRPRLIVTVIGVGYALDLPDEGEGQERRAG